MKKMCMYLLVVLGLTAATAHADRRQFVWTYQYATIAPGVSELELYQTTKLDRFDSWEYRVEIEHGLTPVWDFSLYQIFIQPEGEAFRWDAFQVRTRYRLAPAGILFFDPLLYLEYSRKTDLAKQNKLELKLILGKHFNRYVLAVNPVYEFYWAPGEPVHELGYDIGLGYEFSYSFSLGVETSGRFKFKDTETESSFYIGPTISFASGNIYYTLGYVVGLSDSGNDGRVRFLLGVEL